MAASLDADGGQQAGIVRFLAIVCDSVAIVVLAFIVGSRLFYTRLHLTRQFELDRVALIALAIGLLLLARASQRLAARVVLAGTIVLTLTSVGTVVLIMRSVDVASAVQQILVRSVLRQHTPDIAVRDERYGYVLRPNAHDRERQPDFDVMYTVDATGHRVTPSPEQPRATVAFVGDSFTFGDGVEDTQTYSWLLGTQWSDVKVVNAGVSGWGITQGYLAIADLLASTTPPSVIVYEMIPDDIYRSYLRTPVTTGVRRRLEFVNGRFEMREAPATTPAITQDLEEKEIALARDLIVQMQVECERHHVPFAVLLLVDRGVYPPELVHALGEHHIPTVDLTRIRYERFTHDYHPNAADHRRIADAIKSSSIGALIDVARR